MNLAVTRETPAAAGWHLCDVGDGERATRASGSEPWGQADVRRGDRVLEAFLLDWKGDAYGDTIEAAFVKRYAMSCASRAPRSSASRSRAMSRRPASTARTFVTDGHLVGYTFDTKQDLRIRERTVGAARYDDIQA